MNIIELLDNNYNNFTNRQKQIADYLKSNSSDICYMSLNNLSKKVGCSEMTILSFAKKIGFKNFISLKKHFREYNQNLINQLSTSSYTVPYDNDLYEDNSKIKVINEICNIELTRIQNFYNNINPNEILEISKMFIDKKMIYIFAHDASIYNAKILDTRLELLNFNTKLVDLKYMKEIEKALSNIDKKDLCIFFAFPNYYYCIENIAINVKDKGAKVLLFTDSYDTQIANISDKSIATDTSTKIFRNSMILPISMIYLLTAALALETTNSNIQDTIIE